ncbi:MAG: TetR/AcrR family transcriptional regulator [Bacteroidetes bacterium]|nr:MAG: TetR/AcrR family transcriptional regulator [Bacteroidota bacterium]
MSDLRQEILSKTRELFMRYGLKSITMDDIARQLGISKKTLYQVVDNKADLVHQLFEKHIEDEKEMMHKILSESHDAIDEILGIGRFVIQKLRELSPTVVYDLRKYYHESWAKMEALHQQFVYKVIKANLERGQKEGLYRTNLNPDIVAKLYVGKASIMVDENLFPLRDYNKELLFREFIFYHIHGVASPKGLTLFEQYIEEGRL